mgnify:CR=1 FL=1
MNVVKHTEKKKYSAKINYCPECGEKLIYVCKSHGCFKPLDEAEPEHSYCNECRTKREDRKENVKAVAKKGAEVVGVIAVPAIKVLQKEAPKIAEQVAEKAINVAAEAIKKKKL